MVLRRVIAQEAFARARLADAAGDRQPPAPVAIKRRRLDEALSAEHTRTGRRFLNKVGSGLMPAVEAQRSAADIVGDFGLGNSLVNGFASLGARGARPGNCHRDLMRWSKTFGIQLQPLDVDITCKNVLDHGTQIKSHRILLPHEVFSAVYSAGPELFEKVFLGPGGSDGLSGFWERQKTHAWVREHPGFLGTTLEFKHAVPMGIHADKGQHISRDKMLIIAFGSCTSVEPTLWSKILFTTCPDELLIKGTTDEELYAILVWSFKQMSIGKWPEADHNNIEWPYGSRRWAMRGKPLAGPFVGLFSEFRGDWEWSAETFMWRFFITDLTNC
jgi:hypothetical protein